ncbi:vitellogenin-like [Penaeus japonicus]|nr:vitellogenin-like [Penaeus japonicus]
MASNCAKFESSLQVVQSADSAQVVDLVVFVGQESANSYSTKIQIDLPNVIRAIKFESKLEEQEQFRFLAGMALRIGDTVILQADGPLTAKILPCMTLFQTDLTLNVLSLTPYRISSQVTLESDKQLLAFVVKSQREPVFVLEWNSTAVIARKSISIKVLVPSVANLNTDIAISPEIIHVCFNNLILPLNPLPRRIKCFVDANLMTRHVTGRLFWDADVDVNKSVSAEVFVEGDAVHPRRIALHGGVTYLGQTYHYKTKVTIAEPKDKLQGGNDFTLEVTTPSHSSFVLETSYKVDHHETATKVYSTVMYTSTQNEKYRLTNFFGLETGEEPHGCKVDSEVILSTPTVKDARVQARFKYHSHPFHRNMNAQISLSASPDGKPLGIQVTVLQSDTLSSGSCKILEKDPIMVYEWRLVVYPSGGIKTFEVGADVSAVIVLMKEIRCAILQEGDVLVKERTPKRSIFRYRFDNPTPSSYSILIETPSRKIQGKAKVSDSESGLRLSSDEDSSHAKYELIYTSRGIDSGKYKSRWEWHIDHPELTKPVLIDLEYTVGNNTLNGTIELDIFPEEDKITGTLTSMHLTNASIETQVSITSQVLKTSPKLIFIAANAPGVVAYDITFWESPSLPPSLKIAYKYHKAHYNEATFAFTVLTETDMIFEMVGLAKNEETSTCDGVKISATVHSPTLGKYLLDSKLCNSAFAGMTIARDGSEFKYSASLGLQNSNNVEISLTEGTTEREEVEPIALARMRLVNPSMLRAEAAYEKERLDTLWSDIEASEVIKNIISWAKALDKDILRDFSAGRKSGVLTFIDEGGQELREIWHQVIYDDFFPKYEELQYMLTSWVTDKAHRLSKYTWAHLAQLQHHYSTIFGNMAKRTHQELRSINNLLKGALIEIERLMKTGRFPGVIVEIIKEVKTSEIFSIVEAEVDAILEGYPEEYEAVKQVVDRIMTVLEQDTDKLRERIMKIPAVRRITNWILKESIMDHFKISKEIDKIISDYLEESLFLSVKPGANHVMLHVPVAPPAPCLFQALWTLLKNPFGTLDSALVSSDSYTPRPLDDAIWAYYTLFPKDVTSLLPPYPRTAMVIGGTEILTFDGLVVRVPGSPCKVLLTAHGSSTLMMAHTEPLAPPQLELKIASTTVIITPDSRILVDGRMISGPEESIGDVKVQLTPVGVKVTIPSLVVGVSKPPGVIAVEVSGWTFGHTAGLLGTYDGEIGTDRFLPNGSEANSAFQLASAWQEDKQCHTPSLPSLDPRAVPMSRILRCRTLVGGRATCNALVRPEAFVRMCHTARDVCAVAKAYRTICSHKGVEELIPTAC